MSAATGHEGKEPYLGYLLVLPTVSILSLSVPFQRSAQHMSSFTKALAWKYDKDGFGVIYRVRLLCNEEQVIYVRVYKPARPVPMKRAGSAELEVYPILLS
jgi:hypothetical protein